MLDGPRYIHCTLKLKSDLKDILEREHQEISPRSHSAIDAKKNKRDLMELIHLRENSKERNAELANEGIQTDQCSLLRKSVKPQEIVLPMILPSLKPHRLRVWEKHRKGCYRLQHSPIITERKEVEEFPLPVKVKISLNYTPTRKIPPQSPAKQRNNDVLRSFLSKRSKKTRLSRRRHTQMPNRTLEPSTETPKPVLRPLIDSFYTPKSIRLLLHRTPTNYPVSEDSKLYLISNCNNIIPSIRMIN